MTVRDAIELARNWSATCLAISRLKGVSPERMAALEEVLATVDRGALYAWLSERVGHAMESFAHIAEARLEREMRAEADDDPTDPEAEIEVVRGPPLPRPPGGG